MQYLRLGQPPFAPFLISHLWRLCLRIEPMQIRAALGIPILQGRMYPDLVQHLLYRISKRCRGLTLLCQFPQDLGAIFLQHSLWHLQQRHVDRLCCTSIDAAGKVGVRLCVVSGRRFGICTLLLPELQLYRETRYAHLGKGVIRQQNLTKETEVILHFSDHRLVRKRVCQKRTGDNQGQDAQWLQKLGRFQAAIELRQVFPAILCQPSQIEGRVSNHIIEAYLRRIIADILID